MTLAVTVTHRFGDFALDASFASPGGLTALFGASGAGKTSLLRIVAGLVRPASGRVEVDGTVLLDTARRLCLPAHRRGVGYVFQEPRLLPHLSVRHNLGYGRWFSRRGGDPGEFGRVVELLDIGRLLERRPAALSGGEAQRVAIGRALLARPRLLLMDEPLASIDEPRKAEIIPYIERLRDGSRVPIVYVSHALDEIVRLATTLVVLEHGRVAAAGDLATVLGRVDLPILARRADAGVVLDVEVAAHEPRWQLTVLRCQAGLLHVPAIEAAAGSRRRIWVRARDVSLALSAPADSSILNQLPAQVVRLAASDGASVDVQLDCSGATLLARVTRLSAERLALRPGLAVQALVKGIAFERAE
ncbi:MAG: molybdenum ABC transporter ATP-binding protein [Nevskia sp.]|nr:molybdenum ABC transporter ATP-binding protein [Nevskia sp.]